MRFRLRGRLLRDNFGAAHSAAGADAVAIQKGSWPNIEDCVAERDGFELQVPICEQFMRQHQVKLCDIETNCKARSLRSLFPMRFRAAGSACKMTCPLFDRCYDIKSRCRSSHTRGKVFFECCRPG